MSEDYVGIRRNFVRSCLLLGSFYP
uniref:Uncharacterized protein n=1 Tax=Arundo donax TaxID=35708 RepID=A0A0A9CHE1_ARUDO